MGRVLILPRQSKLGRRAKSGAQGRRQSARTQPALLSAAMDKRRQLHPIANPQRADPLGTMQLVRGYGDQVCPGRCRQLACALHRIAQ